MILSDKAKSLRLWMPDALRAHITEGVTVVDAVQSLLESDRNFVTQLAEAFLNTGAWGLESYHEVDDAIKREHDHLVRCAIDGECDFVASILDDPEELAGYRELRGDLLIGWEDYI